jgi:hypothetical protein
MAVAGNYSGLVIYQQQRSAALIAAAAALFGIGGSAQAQQLGDPFVASAAGACSVFHCDAEGTNFMQHAMPLAAGSGTSLTATSQLVSTANDLPGDVACSSDDSNAVCLFQSGTDAVISYAAGAQGQTQMQRNFVLAHNSNPGAPKQSQFAAIQSQGSGRAPVAMIGQDHSVIVADGNWVKRLTQNGTQVWPTALTPAGIGDVGAQLGYESSKKRLRAVVGITPIQWGGETAVAVTFNDGPTAATNDYASVLVFRLTDGSVIAKYPANATDSTSQGFSIPGTGGNPVYYPSVSPPVSHGSSLYFVGYNATLNGGVLARLDLSGSAANQSASQLKLTSYQTFGGQSGSSAVYADNARFTVFPYSELVLHVPDPTTGSIAQLGCNFAAGGTPVTGDHLISFSPDLSTCNWASPLTSTPTGGKSTPLLAAPAVDPVNGGFWAWTMTTPGSYAGQSVFHYPAQGGPSDRSINASVVCSAAKLNCGSNAAFVGHMYAVNPPGTQKLYLTSFISSGLGNGAAKNVVAFDAGAGVRNNVVIKWLAPITDVTGFQTGGSLPMLTFGNGTPGLMFSASNTAGLSGDLSLVSQ